MILSTFGCFMKKHYPCFIEGGSIEPSKSILNNCGLFPHFYFTWMFSCLQIWFEFILVF